MDKREARKLVDQARAGLEFLPVSDGIVMHFGEQHSVTEAREWTSQHGVPFTDWRTACGKEGTASGSGQTAPAGLLSGGRVRQLRMASCKECKKTARGWR